MRVVIASDRTPALIGGELHATFKVDPDGEYLVLVRPDGVTVASEHAPEYPAQSTDVAFGLRPDTAKTRDVYMRQVFIADNPVALDTLTLRVKYDDGFVAGALDPDAGGTGGDSGVHLSPCGGGHQWGGR